MGDLTSVVGYGSFITLRFVERFRNVEPCLVRGYRRIYPKGHGFPFLLPAEPEGGFWALKFDVNSAELKQLDRYEGFPTLYERITTQVTLRSKEQILAEVYLPSRELIKREKLSQEMDPDDRWLDVILEEVPDLVLKWPEIGARRYLEEF